jgi:hypothetical protein
MNSIDLDTLRSRWARASDRLDANLHLDVAAMRAALAARTRRSVRFQFPCLAFELLLDLTLVLALAAFVVTHARDPLYLASGLALLAFPLAGFVLAALQWRTLARLDYTEPALALRARLDAIRHRRVRLSQAILYAAVPLWWPAVAVGFMGLFGVDLLRGLPPSIHVVSFLTGAVILVVGLPLGRWIARRYGARPGYQDFLDDVAGMGWRRLRGGLDAQAAFERELHEDGAAAALDARRAPPLPAEALLALARLQRRLLLAAFCYAGLILLTGGFNALHGGQWPFLVPGVLLNFAWIAQMVAAIVLRVSVVRLDASLPRANLQRRVAAVAAWHARIAQRTLVFAPLLGLLLAQVLGKALFGVNLAALLGTGTAAGLGLLALGATLWLARRRRRDPVAFAARGVSVLTLGAAGLARRLADRLGGSARED